MSPIRQVLVFFAAAFALTWVCQSPGVLALRHGVQPGSGVMLLMAIGSAGPSLVAIALSALRGGRAGVRALLRSPASPPLGLLAVALLFPIATHLIGSAALMLAGQYSATHLLYPPLRPEQIAIAVVAPLGEEYGWRGYALPRLQASLTPVSASLLLGVVWALWHVPTLFMPGATPSDLWMYLPAYLASSIIYTWLYNAGGGSVLGPLLAHLGIHLDNVFRAAALGDGLAPLYSTSAALIAMALGLVATGRMRAPSKASAPAVA
jgi:membrane protease YdiL (CAAX protease family)